MKRIAPIIALLALFALWSAWPPAKADGGDLCDRTVSVSIAAAAAQTIAPTQTGNKWYVCGYDLSADTIATTLAWLSSATTISGTMRFCDECGHQAGDGNGVIMEGVYGGNIVLSAATGAITGWVRIGPSQP